MSRAASRAGLVLVPAFTGRFFSPFLTIRIVFFSDILVFGTSYLPISNEILAIQFPNSYLERWSGLDLAKGRPKTPKQRLRCKSGHVAIISMRAERENSRKLDCKRYTSGNTWRLPGQSCRNLFFTSEQTL